MVSGPACNFSRLGARCVASCMSPHAEQETSPHSAKSLLDPGRLSFHLGFCLSFQLFVPVGKKASRVAFVAV